METAGENLQKRDFYSSLNTATDLVGLKIAFEFAADYPDECGDGELEELFEKALGFVKSEADFDEFDRLVAGRIAFPLKALRQNRELAIRLKLREWTKGQTLMVFSPEIARLLKKLQDIDIL